MCTAELISLTHHKLFLFSLIILSSVTVLQIFKMLKLESNSLSREAVKKMNLTALSKSSDEVQKLDTFEEEKKSARRKAINDGVQNVQNVPHYSFIMEEMGHSRDPSCAPFPTLFEIFFSNTYWQTQATGQWTFHILSAFIDNRELNANGTSIRILGSTDRLMLANMTSYCQIWFADEKHPTISKVDEYELAWPYDIPHYRKYSGVIPYIWNCPLPREKFLKIPVSVSVVENDCDEATTNVKVHYEMPVKKEKLAICVRAMNFPSADISFKLVEWLEIVRLFKVQKVFLYEQNVHPNTAKVIQYYTKKGFVDVSYVTFPPGPSNEKSLSEAFDFQSNFYSWITESLPLHDCLYRNMYKYDNLAVLDIDEIIFGSRGQSWPELVSELKYQHRNIGDITSFQFRSTIYNAEMKLEPEISNKMGIPSSFSFLREVYRGCDSRPQGTGSKSIHDPVRIKVLHNHFSRKCLGDCLVVKVDSTVADVHHHRGGLLKLKFCENDTFVVETSLWKWKQEIINNVTSVLTKLNLNQMDI